MLYHMVVARKEVLVQLDDELVARLDELAAKAEISRSELIRRGMAAVLEAADLAEADRELIAAYKRLPQDPLLTEALTRLAGETAPKW
jgi:metal-responsive CopG/Arc/MetJ family transcriptional regulator